MASRVLSKSTLSGVRNSLKMSEMLVRLMSASAGPSNVGFIGLGNMGGFMAKNLAKQVIFNELQ